MTQEPQKSNAVLIIIAVIGVIGTIVASTIGVVGNYNIEKMRQEAELTRIALVSIATRGGATQISMANTISAPTSSPYPTNEPLPTYTAYPTYTPIPLPTFSPTPSVSLPFIDDFNDGLDSSWRIINGAPYFNEGSLGAINEAVTIEIGDDSFGDVILEFDYSNFNNQRGISVYFSKIYFAMDYIRLRWYIFNNNGWQEFNSKDAVFDTWVSGHLKIVITGNKYSIFQNGDPFNEIIIGEAHQGPLRIKVSDGVFIDNVSLYE
jgi:hypothetical protein